VTGKISYRGGNTLQREPIQAVFRDGVGVSLKARDEGGRPCRENRGGLFAAQRPGSDRNPITAAAGARSILSAGSGYRRFYRVRLRRSKDFGGAAYSIDARKQARIIATARHYLADRRKRPAGSTLCSSIASSPRGSNGYAMRSPLRPRRASLRQFHGGAPADPERS